MKRLILASVFLAAPFCNFAPAQAGAINGILQVDVCDPTTNGGQNCLKPQSDGSLNVNGTFSATLAGFTPNGSVANLSVTTSSANVALPTGLVVAVLNSGASDVSIKLSVGAGSAATTDFVLKSGATVGLTVGSNTYINAITASGSSTLSLAGGTGLVSGYGGGGAGGSGGGDASAANQTVVQGVIGAATAPTKMNTVGCVYNSTPITLTNGQSAAAQCDANGYGKVYVTNNGVAQGAAISGQTPSTIAGQTLTANPTAFSTATTNPVTLDEYGAVLTRPYSLGAALVQGTTSAMTGTTSTSLVAAPGSGLRNYITNLTCVNSHATVGTFVTVQDGSGGTALYTLAAAALFGGASITFPAPLRQPTANTALYVADVTTGANTICSATGYKAP
jgi:hypothetical protein